MKKIIFLGILVFIVSVGVGYVYSNLFFYENSNKDISFELNEIKDYAISSKQKEQVEEVYSKIEKVSPNANFAIKQYYDECNHFDFKYSRLPQELINMTRQEVEDYYDQYEIEEFNSNNIVLSREINGFCNEHFFITLGDSNIEVMQLDTDGTFIPYQETDISREYLAVEDVNKLEEGLFVFGSGNINSILEDYE